jgi:hypothetical protein
VSLDHHSTSHRSLKPDELPAPAPLDHYPPLEILVRERLYAALMLRFGEVAFEELVAIGDAEELCRRLLASPWGWGSSTRHAEAVELLGKVQGTGELPMSFVALMLCTCRRWDRVTSRLIAAIEDSGLLDRAGARRVGPVIPLP